MEDVIIPPTPRPVSRKNLRTGRRAHRDETVGLLWHAVDQVISGPIGR